MSQFFLTMKSMKSRKKYYDLSFLNFMCFTVKTIRYKTKLFNPSFNNLTLKLIKYPCLIFASFMYDKI